MRLQRTRGGSDGREPTAGMYRRVLPEVATIGELKNVQWLVEDTIGEAVFYEVIR